jgi:glycosyltransferase involved in cell wall biosynthesis
MGHRRTHEGIAISTEVQAVVRMNAKIKYLLLDTNDAVGGVVRQHLLFLNHLDRTRFDVHAAVLGHGPLLPLFQAVPEVTLETMEVGTKPAELCAGWRSKVADVVGVVALVASAVRLAARCRRAGIQVIHTSDKKRSLLLTLLLHRLTGIPYLYHIHNNYIDYPANRQALAQAAIIIANSAAMRRDFIQWLGPSMDRIRLLYNGVDAERFNPNVPPDLKAELGAGPDEVLIGISSRLAPDKGQDTFLHAAGRVASQEPRTRFVIVGDDSIFSDNADYVPMLRRLSNDLDLANRVAFLGFRQDMPTVYNSLDILVNAAWREAFGLVVVEAMACAKVVIGTQAGGIPEIITHGRDGFLFPVGDDKALADVLLELVRKPDLRRAIGQTARQTVLERFTIETQVKALEQVLAEIAGAESTAAFSSNLKMKV